MQKKIIKLKFNITLFFFTSFVSQNAFSIINIETIRGQNKAGSIGGLNINFLGERGNSERFTGNLKTLNAYVTDLNEFLVFTDYTYGESRNIKDTNRANAHFRYTLKDSELFYKEFFYQIEFDEFRSLDFRQLIGTGLRTSVFKTEKTNLAIGYGFFHESEYYDQAPDEERIRLNLYLAYFQELSPDISLAATLYFQPDIEVFKDIRSILTTTLKTKITDSISFINNINGRLDSQPVSGIRKYDISYNFGLSYDY